MWKAAGEAFAACCEGGGMPAVQQLTTSAACCRSCTAGTAGSWNTFLDPCAAALSFPNHAFLAMKATEVLL